MNELQIAKEVFMSIIKWFLIVLLLNNLIWGIVVFKMLSGEDVGMTQIQDGTNNLQEMSNG
jgi:hypothetical protein